MASQIEQKLGELAFEVLEALRLGTVSLMFAKYHDFGKAALTPIWLEHLLDRHHQSRNDIQIDVISVHGDLSNQIHYHSEAFAYLVILGTGEGAPDPIQAQVFIQNEWHPIAPGKVIVLPPGTRHGFRTLPAHEFWFLSLQAPPIVRPSGDDYHLAIA